MYASMGSEPFFVDSTLAATGREKGSDPVSAGCEWT